MGIARVGPRLWKTGLAVAIAAALGSLLHLYAFYCALAAATREHNARLTRVSRVFAPLEQKRQV